MNSSNDSGSNKPSPGSAAAEVWQNTRAQTALATQFLEDEDAYLAPGTRDIGRETSVNAVSYTHLTLPTKRIV